MTPERIAELKRLCDAATEGPWFTGAQNDMLFVIDGAPSPSPYDGTIPKVCGPSVVCTPNWRDMPFEANAAFIAASREALPALLAENEKLRRALFPYADVTEISGFSWNGFNIIGSRKSVDAVSSAVHLSGQIEEYRKGSDEAKDRFKADLAAAEAERDRMRAAAKSVLGNMFSTWRASNGRDVGVQANDGEKCWIVHSDDIEALRCALGQKP